MGRKVVLPANFYDHNFCQLVRTQNHARVRIRLLGLAHIQEGKSYTQVAEMMKVSLPTVISWVKRFACGGLSGLEEQSGRGAKCLLREDQQKLFQQAVLELQKQRPGGRVRGQDILQLLADQFGIHCTLNTVYHTLARVKMSWISSRSRHPQSDPAKQEAFKKTS